MALRRHFVAFALFSLVISFIIVRLIGAPNYPDAYYHLNGANRLVSGQGFTEPYLWTYVGALDALPPSGVFPSHLYWMPITSVSAALGMTLFGNSYGAAQIPFALMLWGTTLIGFASGWRLGNSMRHAWVAGLLTLFSGYFTRFWGTIDTFAPYALFGSACLYLLGGNRTPLRLLIAGVCAGFAHLTRADGLLLLIVGWIGIYLHPPRNPSDDLPLSTWRGGWGVRLLVFTIGYLIVMSLWFARNLDVIGAPLPFGGTATIWLREYNEIFSYPPSILTPSHLFADGIGVFLSSRWEAFVNNLGTFVAVEGLIAMTPLMLIGVWVRRRNPSTAPFALYALGLHAAMTLAFPFPGYRGGLFHSAAALVPFWAAYGVVGLDAAVDWAAKRRRWRGGTAKPIFSAALVGLALYLSYTFGRAGQVPASDSIPPLYALIQNALPSDARVMINDPAGLYYFTGLGGVALPNAAPDVIPDIARRYDIDYLLLESPDSTPAPLISLFDAPPDFLIPIPFDGGRLYAINLTPP